MGSPIVTVSDKLTLGTASFKPRFVRKFAIIPFEDGLLVDGANQLQILKGKATHALLSDLLKLMDGTRAIVEIQAALPLVPGYHISSAISLLYKCGLIEDGGCDTAPSNWNPETFSYLQRYVGVCRSYRNAVDAYLAMQRVVIVVGSDKSLSRSKVLISLLERTGVKSCLYIPRDRFLDEFREFESGFLVTSIAIGHEEDLWHAKLDDWSAEHRKDWLRIFAQENAEIFELGPYFRAAAVPCFRCWLAQLPRANQSGSEAIPFTNNIYLEMSAVAVEIINIMAHTSQPLTFREVQRYTSSLQALRTFRCSPVPGCARCRPVPLACKREDRIGKIDSAIAFEDYIGLRSREDSSSGYQDATLELDPGPASGREAKRIRNSRKLELNREFVRFNRPVLDLQPRDLPMPDGGLTLNSLSPLLLMTAGVRNRDSLRIKRWAATAGNLGSVELFLVAHRVSGLDAGTYFYQADDHSLALFEGQCDPMKSSNFLRHVLPNADHIPDATVFFTGALHRLSRKYGSFAYRLIHLDSGAGMSQMRLVADALGIPCQNIHLWPEEPIEKYLNLERFEEIPMGLLSISARNSGGKHECREGSPRSFRSLEELAGLRVDELMRMAYLDSWLTEADIKSGPFALHRGLCEAEEQACGLFKLPAERQGGQQLDDVLAKRTSIRKFNEDPVTLVQLSTILGYAHRWDRNEWLDGHTPEEPLKFIVVVNNVEALEAGVYSYHPLQHGLKKESGPLSVEDRTALFVQAEFALAPVTVWIAGNLSAACTRYGSFGHRRLLLRAGTAGHHLWMASLGLGMAGCLIAGIVPGATKTYLGMDGYTSAALLAVATGHRSLHPEVRFGPRAFRL